MLNIVNFMCNLPQLKKKWGKKAELSLAGQRSQRFKAWGINVPLLASIWRGPHGKEYRQPLGAQNTIPGWLPTRKWNHSPTVTKNQILPTIRMRLNVDFPPEPPDKISIQPTPWFQPCSTLSKEPSQPCQTPDLQSYELIIGCCFKVLTLNQWLLIREQ